MYLTPLIRANRAIAVSLLYPNHPIQTIAISECASIIFPVLNPEILPCIIGIIFAIMYNPTFAQHYVKKLNEINTIHDQAEICTILLFNLILSVNYLKYL